MGPEELNKKQEAVHSPSHYVRKGTQAIEAFHAMVPPVEFQGAMRLNVLKYIWRFREKGGAEDLKKAQLYLTWLINSVEGSELEIKK